MTNESMNFIHFLLEADGIPLVLAIFIYYLLKPLKKLSRLVFPKKTSPKTKQRFSDTKINIKIT
jgi:hypothetical protein